MHNAPTSFGLSRDAPVLATRSSRDAVRNLGCTCAWLERSTGMTA